MLPHPHRGDFNIAPCKACGEKHMCHTETGAQKQCNSKIQTSFAILVAAAKPPHPHKERERRKNKIARFYIGGAIF
jgi:hypothetical protein